MGASSNRSRFGDTQESVGDLQGENNLELEKSSKRPFLTKEQADNMDNIVQISNKNSLIWLTIKLDGQELPAMLDSGANPNCISWRCV